MQKFNYNQPDKELIVNDNDPDLRPIHIPLPSLKSYKKVDGYGLPPREQKFQHQIMPVRLAKLQKECETISEIWDRLEADKEYFAKEIKWIELQWERRIKGYWFFNNGAPVYLDGWQYFYLNYWNLDIGLPEYRSRDRKFFMFARFCYTDTKAVYNFKIKHDNKNYYFATRDGAIKLRKKLKSDSKIQEGVYFVDFNNRLCFGFNYPKHRREGATSKAACINYEIISRMSRVNGGIQSRNEKDSKKVFRKHIMPAFKRMSFFFKPEYEGTTDSKSELSFNPPARRLSSRGSKMHAGIGLESMIDYRASGEKMYDGDKLHFFHGDEEGKDIDTDVIKRNATIRECLSQGPKIHGFSIATSTVGEMEKGGGKKFEEKCKLSNYHIRGKNGKTITGLYTLFIPAYEMEGFIDQYGNSIIDDPAKWQEYEEKKRGIGAKEYLENERQSYIDAGDHEGLSEQIREFPIRYRECFRTGAKQSGFNIQKLELRQDELRFDTSLTRRGNFAWINGRDSQVEWIDNEEGKFYRSFFGDMNYNARYYDSEIMGHCPLNTTKVIAGGDPFNFNKTIDSRKSKGGGAVFLKYDPIIDHQKIDINDWKTHRFICTYANRTYDKNEYGEDMLMMCVFFSCQMNPEIDVPFLWDYFTDRGYAGYLLYQYDMKTKNFKDRPGMRARESVQQIFTEYMTYIEKHIHREAHGDLIEELIEIGGPHEMTHYDLFAAGGYALLGANSIYNEIEEIKTEQASIDDYFETHSYN